MKVGLRHFGDDSVRWFQQASVSGELTRTGLARQLCERSDWRNPQGKLCIDQASKILPRLAAKLKVSLPSATRHIPRARSHAPFQPIAKIQCALEELGMVSVEPVCKEQTSSWYAMMQSWHPQGAPKLPGQAVKYWVVSEHHGYLGGGCPFMHPAGMRRLGMISLAGHNGRGPGISSWLSTTPGF